MTCKRCGKELPVADAAIVKNLRGDVGSIHAGCIVQADTVLHLPGRPLKAARREIEYPPDWQGVDTEELAE